MPEPSQPDAFEGRAELLTIEEAAQYLRVHHLTVYRWIKRKRNPLPVLKLGKRIYRISLKELHAWAKENAK